MEGTLGGWLDTRRPRVERVVEQIVHTAHRRRRRRALFAWYVACTTRRRLETFNDRRTK